MPVFASSRSVHGAGKAIMRVQEDEKAGAFQRRPDWLEGGVVEALGEPGGAEDDAAEMRQEGNALDFTCDVRRGRGERKRREGVKTILTR